MPLPPGPAPTPTTAGAIEVLWREPIAPHAQALLLGVDLARRRAYVRVDSREPPAWALVTVDLDRGRRLHTWTAVDPEPLVRDGDRFHAPSGNPQADRARLAAMMLASGPWHARAWEHWPIDAASSGAIVWTQRPSDGRDGDWLWLSAGGAPMRLGAGLLASYHTTFAPGGARVAWVGCRRSPCGYDLHIATLSTFLESGRFVSAGVLEPDRPRWSADGRTIYSVGVRARVPGAGLCIYRVDAQSARATTLDCLAGLATLDLDPSGHRGIVTFERGLPGTQLQTYAEIDLASGKLGRRHVLDRGTGDVRLAPNGEVLICGHQLGLAVVDLAADRHAIVPYAQQGFFSLLHVAWQGGRPILLRTHAGEVEIVRLDPRQLLAGAAAK